MNNDVRKRSYLPVTLIALIFGVIGLLLAAFTVLKDLSRLAVINIPFGLTVDKLYAIVFVYEFVLFLFSVFSFISVGSKRRKTPGFPKWPGTILIIFTILAMGVLATTFLGLIEII